MNGQNSAMEMLETTPADSADFVSQMKLERERTAQQAEDQLDELVASAVLGNGLDASAVVAALAACGKTQADWLALIEQKKRRIADAALLAKREPADAERVACAADAQAEGERFKPLADEHNRIIRAITVRFERARDDLNASVTAEQRLRETARPSLRAKFYDLCKRRDILARKADQLRDVRDNKLAGERTWRNALKTGSLSELRRKEAIANADGYAWYAQKAADELAAVDAKIAEMQTEIQTTQLAMLQP